MAAPLKAGLGRRIALVTGAGQGIGRAIAYRLARDGYSVAINDIPTNSKRASTTLKELQQITQPKGGQASLHFGDVTNEKQVQKMIDEVVKEHSSLDVMVANAGILYYSPLLDTPVEIVDKIMSVNFRGVFLCYKYAAKQMITQGRGGRIIGASSLAGKQGWRNLSVYSASKFAVRGLTQSVAQELGPHKITVNAYAPGCIETDMLDQVDAGYMRFSGGGEKSEIRAMWARDTCVGYNGTPAEIASLVSYLASEEAHYITGQSVSCNGGSFFD
ncbi:acetoin reductase [Moniliophthora roreri MCA 2997]|uniref:Acetoin reductase n=1 Tax=Moniliophthora roreri (strain MCA 2997) TaxID=1381753 RepID=V2YNW7_MONRO|nr:acetoin reductase [Moniliophthora roreri MCA 2997]